MLERILLIDDSEADAMLIQRALKKGGLDDPVFWIRDAEEAVAYLQGLREYGNRDLYPIPNILLLDIRMPKMNGLQLLQWLKLQPDLNRVLVVMITGLEDTKQIAEAYSLGAQSYLNKEGTLEEFQHFVAFAKGYAQITRPVPMRKAQVSRAA
jgi:CheY-like chemotaxis protein